MNILRMLFGDRRKKEDDVPMDRRRKGVFRRWKESGERLDQAVAMLDQTVRMNTAEFSALLQKTRDHEMTLVQNGASKAVEFSTFSDICQFRYSPEGSLMRLCKNASHEAAGTGIAPCQRSVCPFYTERDKK